MGVLSKALSAAKGVADLPGQDVSESASIREKMQNVSALKGSSSPAPTPAPVKPAGTSPKDKIAPGAKYGDRGKEKRIDVKDMVKPLGSYKKGGKIKKTGIYKLHAKERVLNAKQTKQVEKTGMVKGLSK